MPCCIVRRATLPNVDCLSAQLCIYHLQDDGVRAEYMRHEPGNPEQTTIYTGNCFGNGGHVNELVELVDCNAFGAVLTTLPL
jgi:hypothetical protein